MSNYKWGSFPYRSTRDMRLAYDGAPQSCPVLTVELYMKWYHLFLVMPTGKVERLDERWEWPDGTAWFDHVPNPEYIQVLAQRFGYEIDHLAYELIIGRYEREVKDRYDY